MAEYSQLLIFDCRFLILHANMQLTQAVQHANVEKSGSCNIVVELLIRRDAAKYSQRKKSDNKRPLQF